MPTHRQVSPQSQSEGAVRKRVCKACDRCRLKKSKCDGVVPCSRCQIDNMVCEFGERKKTQDRVYPKGYVEMLEHQQVQLVSGLQELYRISSNGEPWPGAPLDEGTRGFPLTHSVLDRLGVLEKNGVTDKYGPFEENFTKAQERLIAHGAEMQRKDSSDGTSNATHSPSSSRRMSIGDQSSSKNYMPTPKRPDTPQVDGSPAQSPQQLQYIYARRQQEYHSQAQAAVAQGVFCPGLNTFRDQDFDVGAAIQYRINNGCGRDDTPELQLPPFQQPAHLQPELLEALQQHSAQYAHQDLALGLALPHAEEDIDFNAFVHSNPQNTTLI
ncbi:hypothetical protein FQN49_008458 [Arthroderma sp. PD_2]|nr:hypothetical protein FQN49_008458 [Arthroderma sp. PD_2]